MENVLGLDPALMKYLTQEAEVKIVITKNISMQNIRDMIQEIISSYKIETKEGSGSVVTLLYYIKILWKKL